MPARGTTTCSGAPCGHLVSRLATSLPDKLFSDVPDFKRQELPSEIRQDITKAFYCDASFQIDVLLLFEAGHSNHHYHLYCTRYCHAPPDGS